MSRLQYDLPRTLPPEEISAGPSVPALLAAIDDAAPDLVQRIAKRIQDEVPAFAGGRTGRRHGLIVDATAAGVRWFLHAAGGSRGAGKVDDVFVRMGYGEATEGHEPAAIQEALRLAGRIARDELRTIVVQQGGSAAILRWLGELVDDEMEHLHEQVAQGYSRARRARAADPVRARRRIMRMMLDGAAWPEVGDVAAAAGWTLPESLVVVSAQGRDGAGSPETDGIDLVQAPTGDDAVVFAGSAAEVDRLLDSFGGVGGEVRVAVSWPVPVSEVADAHRWTMRALELVQRGVLPDVPVTHCGEHHSELWLHAEPALRRRMCQELLRPLLAETPNSREILSETLLDWLKTHDSAPNIADRLGVHPQTVRYRWKRINEIFGESLHDAEFVIQITMVLKASVPLWKAGDHSDFERYRHDRKVTR